MPKHAPILLILLVYLILGGLYASYTPDWQAPDEPAHYNYVKQLANGRFPIMQQGDYNEATKNEIVSAKFAPQYSIDSFTYEDWQPPLYYLLLTPVFWLADGSLLALRLASLVLGGGVVLLAYVLARRLFPDKWWLAWGTAVFVAFLPQHLAIMASVNNDALAELIIAGILVVLVGKWQVASGKWQVASGKWQVGLLLGLGYLTKGTVYPLTAVIALALLWRYWGDWRGLIRAGLQVAGPAFVLGALWWGRNVAIYGGLDVLGKAAHDAVVVGQPRTADWIAAQGFGPVARQFIQTTFHSFWGQFGWMALPMNNPGWLYPLLWVGTAVVILGLVFNRQASCVMRHASSARLSPQSSVLITTFLLTLAVHVGYNITFVQHQGRYLFPALLPIGVGVAVGLEAWLRLPFLKRYVFLPNLAPLGLGLGLAALDLWALFRIIVPGLA
jgi:4-amino-4-deoxy-L-arabinose transferase-like glycosyltransferase